MARDKTGKKQGAEPWKPGQSGNPAGRPKGARNRLGEDFIQALADDFNSAGKTAIVEVRTERPQDYLKVIASLLPKQAEITINEYEHMDDAQLRGALGAALRDLAALGVDIGYQPSQGSGGEGEGKPVKPVSPLH